MRLGALLAAVVLTAVAGACAAQLAPGESNVTAQGPTGKLGGVMQAPPTGVTGAPAAIIIPGSGPTDRNGNSRLGITASTYEYLAHGLAPLGITTVRIDKRGMFASAGAGDPDRVTLEGYADDIRAWIASVRQATGAPCVWIIGHSEGGLVALVTAQKPEGICGLVLLATPGLPVADTVRAQLRGNPANAPILSEALADTDKLAAGQHVDQATMNPALLPLYRADVQDFWIEEFKLDQPALAAAFKGPILVVQGENDLQESVAGAQRIAGARPGIRLTLIPGMNHVLKLAPGDRAGNMATYADPSLPLAPGLVEGIATFIKSPPAG